MVDSPFLAIQQSEWIASNAKAFAVWDRYPVSPGHALVIPRRLVSTWFDADAKEQAAVLELVTVVNKYLDATLRPKPDGYNVGFNVGEVAGQTVMHLHVHVIPRYAGDVEDPTGGVRHVIPEKANYLRGQDKRDDQHWQRVMGGYMQGTVPQCFAEVIRTPKKGAPMMMLIRSLSVKPSK